MIAGIVASSSCLFTIHDKFAAVASSSLDKLLWMEAHKRSDIFRCGGLDRPHLQKSGGSTKSKLHLGKKDGSIVVSTIA